MLEVDTGLPYRLWIWYWLRAPAHLARLSIVDDTGVTVKEFCGASAYRDSGVVTWDRELSDDVRAPPGHYAVRYETTFGRDELPFCLRWTRVRPWSEAVEQAPGGTIAGVVVDSAGTPQPFANVIVLGTRRGAQADDHGRFSIPHIPVGDQQVKVFASGHAPAVVPLHVSADSTSTVRIDIGPALPVRYEDSLWVRVRGTKGRAIAEPREAGATTGGILGTVRDRAGQPMALASVIVLGTRRGAQSDEEGTFLITNVPAGEQMLRVFLLGYEPVTRPVQVAPGKTTTIDSLVIAPVVPRLK
jgi:hypothetical protein